MWNGFLQTRVCHSGPLSSGDHYPLSSPEQFNPGKCITLGTAYHACHHHSLWTTGYYLFSWPSLLKPSKGSRSQDLWLLNVKQIKGESKMVNLLLKSLQSRVKEQENKVVRFHWVHPGDRLCCAIPLWLNRLPQRDSRGPWALRRLPDYCCWPQGCSCKAKLCRPSPGAEFLRTLSAAYQPLFKGDELLLTVLFKWAKQTRRHCARLWHWSRRAVVIHRHVSVISN